MKNIDSLITIGITCFNASQSIERALNSALSQDWENFEIVVVDDGSSDDSLNILTKCASNDSRIRLIKHSKNLGCAAARNSIVESARGEFLAFFDDDDVSFPNRLRLQQNHIVLYEHQSHNELIACYASGRRIYPNGYVMPIKAVGSNGPAPLGYEMANYLLFNQRKSDIFYGAGTPACSMMARLSTFKSVGLFDTAMRRQEDIDFAIRLAFMGGRFVGIAESVLDQYSTGGTEKSAKNEFESYLYLINKNKQYLQSKNSYEYMRMWAEMRYRHFSNNDLKALPILMQMLLRYPYRTTKHFMTSALQRFMHEKRIHSKKHSIYIL